MEVKKKKEAFDKIRSKFEKKQVLVNLVKEGTELMCKGDGDSLFSFKPTALIEEGLQGSIQAIGTAPKEGENIIGNFAVGVEKYFMQTTLIKTGNIDLFQFPEELFLLQRRSFNRVELPADVQRAINIVKVNGKSTFLDALCEDISVGGARVTFQNSDIQFKAGDKIEGAFHIKTKWNFQLEGVVKHLVQGADGKQTFGLEFDISNRGNFNKLHVMMLELQRWSVLNGKDGS